MWGAAFLLLGLYLVPVLVSFCLPDPRGGVPWHQARRDPTGLSPDPAVTQEAVIQVFAAPAVAWRGLFSVHTWIAVKPTGKRTVAARRHIAMPSAGRTGSPSDNISRLAQLKNAAAWMTSAIARSSRPGATQPLHMLRSRTRSASR